MSYWITGALLLASAGAQQYNTAQVAEEQDDALAARLRRDAAHQRAADELTSKLIGKTARSDAEDEKAQSMGQFRQALRASRASATTPLGVAGNASDAYEEDATDAAMGISQYGEDQAGMLASMAA